MAIDGVGLCYLNNLLDPHFQLPYPHAARSCQQSHVPPPGESCECEACPFGRAPGPLCSAMRTTMHETRLDPIFTMNPHLAPRTAHSELHRPSFSTRRTVSARNHRLMECEGTQFPYPAAGGHLLALVPSLLAALCDSFISFPRSAHRSMLVRCKEVFCE